MCGDLNKFSLAVLLLLFACLGTNDSVLQARIVISLVPRRINARVGVSNLKPSDDPGVAVGEPDSVMPLVWRIERGGIFLGPTH